MPPSKRYLAHVSRQAPRSKSNRALAIHKPTGPSAGKRKGNANLYLSYVSKNMLGQLAYNWGMPLSKAMVRVIFNSGHTYVDPTLLARCCMYVGGQLTATQSVVVSDRMAVERFNRIHARLKNQFLRQTAEHMIVTAWLKMFGDRPLPPNYALHLRPPK